MPAFFYTYNAIFDAPVSGSAKLVYAYLCKCADKSGKSFPAHKTIARNCAIGVTSVKSALAELSTAGLVTVRGQARPERGRCANLYTVVKSAVKGFFKTYANLFVETLTAKARFVYLYFCRLASGRAVAFPAHKTSAHACGLSVSGVRTAIDELEAAGLVEREAQYRDNGGQRSNLYTLVTAAQSSELEPENARKAVIEVAAETSEAPVAVEKQPPEPSESNSPCFETANGTTHISTNIQKDISYYQEKSSYACPRIFEHINAFCKFACQRFRHWFSRRE